MEKINALMNALCAYIHDMILLLISHLSICNIININININNINNNNIINIINIINTHIIFKL